MFEYVTPQYIGFIKSVLINRCYVEYSNIINKRTNDEKNNNYAENLIQFIEDEEIWKKIFEKIVTVMNYYIYILEDYNKNNNNELNMKEQKQAQTIKQETFQGFIDSRINLNSIGPYDYQKFTNSMRTDEEFRKNLYEKYEKVCYETILKNHIIYVIKLYIFDKTDNSYYNTEEEEKEMDNIALDLIPYFEYLSANKWTSGDDVVYTKEKPNMNIIENFKQMIEKETLEFINNFINH